MKFLVQTITSVHTALTPFVKNDVETILSAANLFTKINECNIDNKDEVFTLFTQLGNTIREYSNKSNQNQIDKDYIESIKYIRHLLSRDLFLNSSKVFYLVNIASKDNQDFNVEEFFKFKKPKISQTPNNPTPQNTSSWNTQWNKEMRALNLSGSAFVMFDFNLDNSRELADKSLSLNSSVVSEDTPLVKQSNSTRVCTLV